MVDSLSNMFLTTPVHEWNNRTRSFDVPDYVVSFSGIVCSALSLTLDDGTVDTLAQFLLDLFGVEPEFQDFILNDYLPEVTQGRGYPGPTNSLFKAGLMCFSLGRSPLT